MKKSLVVLLIAVLVAGYAFAAYTVAGEVSATATYTLGTEPEFAYATDNTLKASFTFEETLSKNAIGTAYPYINVAGSVDLTASLDGQTIDQALELDTFEVVGEGWKLNLIAKSGQFDYAKSAIDSAKVQTKQFAAPVASPYTLSWGEKDNAGIAYTNDNFGTIFVTGEMTAAADAYTKVVKKTQAWDYETSTWKYSSTGYEMLTDSEKRVNTSVEYVATSGTDARYDYTAAGKGFKKEYGQRYAYFINSEALPATASVQVEAETKVLAITDALTAQFAAGVVVDEDLESDFGLSGKFAYNDVATLAFDWDDMSTFDVAGSLKVGIFTFDGYYATTTAVADKNYKGGAGITSPTNKYFSLKAVAEVEEIGTTFTATAQNVLEFEGGKYSVEAVNTYIPGYTFTVGAGYDGTEQELDCYSFNAGVEAEYENGLSLGLAAEFAGFNPIPGVVEGSVGYTSDDFEVSFEGAYDFDEEELEATLLSTYHAEKFDVVGNAYYNTKASTGAGVTCEYYSVEDGLFVEAGIVTDKLVDGAEFSLMYKSGCLFDTTEDFTRDFGAIEAGLTVTF